MKTAVKFINQFEKISADIGISQHFDYVVCGHIHQPEIRRIENAEGSIVYLNSGDWIENLTALEYHKGEWSLYRFAESGLVDMVLAAEDEETELTNNELFTNLLTEFKLMKQ